MFSIDNLIIKNDPKFLRSYLEENLKGGIQKPVEIRILNRKIPCKITVLMKPNKIEVKNESGNIKNALIGNPLKTFHVFYNEELEANEWEFTWKNPVE